MPKPKKGGPPTVCGSCGYPIDREAVLAALHANREYVHPCGRVLARPR